MNTDSMDFNDDLSAVQGRENLWRAVLANAIEEAVYGVSRSHYENRKRRAGLITEARAYVTRQNKDFDMVCYLAGLEPQAVRDRVTKQIAAAPSPEELAAVKRRVRKPKPGVPSNFAPSEGTGAGSTAQEIPEITFSAEATTE